MPKPSSTDYNVRRARKIHWAKISKALDEAIYWLFQANYVIAQEIQHPRLNKFCSTALMMVSKIRDVASKASESQIDADRCGKHFDTIYPPQKNQFSKKVEK